MGQVQFVGVTWRPCPGMSTDVGLGFLQPVNHAERSWSSPFAQVIGNGFFHISLGLFTGNDRFGFHGILAEGVA